MVTKARKTLLQNPLDEIPTRSKSAERAASPVKKTAENPKTVRAAKTVGAAKTMRVAKTAGAGKPVRAAKTGQTVSAPTEAAGSDSSTAMSKRGARATRATRAKPRAFKPKANSQNAQDLLNDQPIRAQTAEQLMAAELVQSPESPLHRREEIMNDPCTPTKVLEQPGTPTLSIGSAVAASQFLTAEDVFQNELSRARVSVKAEITRTRLEAHKIVKRWSRWSIAASMIPTAFVDVAAISSVQVKMIYELCKIYEVDFEHKAALAIASGVAGGAAVQTLAGVLAKQMIRWTPGIGTVFILAIEPAISYVTTNAMGFAFISHFEADGRLHDFKPERIRQYMAMQLDKRKRMFKANAKPGHA